MRPLSWSRCFSGCYRAPKISRPNRPHGTLGTTHESGRVVQSFRMGRLESRGIADKTAGVAQLAEQRTRNAQVRGSSPRSGSNLAFELTRVGESRCSPLMTARLHTQVIGLRRLWPGIQNACYSLKLAGPAMDGDGGCLKGGGK